MQNAADDLRSRLDRHLREGGESGPFRAREILAGDEALRENESAVIDLAYEEYCRRTADGEQIDRSEFAAEFPEVQDSLARLLALHTLLGHPSRDWGSQRTFDWPIVGEQACGFDLVEELGRGAFSRVFLARELAVGGREVVVKFSSRGGDEAAALGKFEHAHVVKVYSARLESNGLVAICMPYEGRRTLQDVCLGARDSVDAVVETFEKLADALDHAHEHGFLHCDVKPSNVLVRENGEPVLLDFNLARDTSRDQAVAGGTLPFMAPEQIAQVIGDRDAVVGPATDVFGLAATMYHVVVGQPPFPADNTSTLHSALSDREHVSELLVELRSRVPAGLARLVTKAMSFDPQCRPANCRAFAGELAAWRRRRSVRRPLAFVAVGAVALAFAAWSLSAPPGSAGPPGEGSQPSPAATRRSDSVVGKGVVAEEEDVDWQAEYREARTLQREQAWDRALEIHLRLLDQDDDELTGAGVDPAMVFDSARFCLLARATGLEDDEAFDRLQSLRRDRATDVGELSAKYAAATADIRSPQQSVVEKAWFPLRSVVARDHRDAKKRMALAVLTLLMSRATGPVDANAASGLRREAELHSRLSIDHERGLVE